MKLMILPHAGGSAKGYCNLKKLLPDNLRLIPMEPAGRGRRISEPCFEDIPICVSNLIDIHMDEILEGDYCILGHSMGTMLATEMTKQIYELKLPEPKHVFLSGRCALDENPGVFMQGVSLNNDEDIMRFFIKNKLIPDQIINSEELLMMITKILTTDVRMTNKYLISPDEFKYKCDISVIYGTEDDLLKEYDMNKWGRFTQGRCKIYPIQGDHFYYLKNKQPLCEIIKNVCNDL